MEWKKVSDEKPDNGIKALCKTPDGFDLGYIHYRHDGCFVCDNRLIINNQPLPHQVITHYIPEADLLAALEEDAREIWKDVSGYEGYYQVSNFGAVKSLHRTIIQKNNIPRVVYEKMLRPEPDNLGFLTVYLCKNEKRKGHKVSHLVADAFVSKSNGCIFVKHIDGDKLNNSATNLAWTDKRGKRKTTNNGNK